MIPKHTCQRCDHWRETGETDRQRTDSGIVEYHMGECWRFPPRVVGVAGSQNLAGHTVPIRIVASPYTRHNMGCGEHSSYSKLTRDPVSREFSRAPSAQEAEQVSIKLDKDR